MAKIQQFIQILLTVCLLIGLNTGSPNAMALTLDLTSDQLAQLDKLNSNGQIAQNMPATYDLVAENENFKLSADKATLAFQVTDKRSGYVWNSNLDEVKEDDQLNKTWTAFATSGISIDYLDQKAASKRASITNAKQAIDYKTIEQGFQASVTFTDVSITIGIIVKLEPQGVSVEVPLESIKEGDAAFKLGLLYLYPFMGATREDSVPGYMFVPEGSGSLIRFSSSTKAKNMLYERYYGTDLGMITNLPYDRTVNRPYKLTIPVYGMVHGEKENAYIAVVEKGASYGEIQAHPAGIITNFNFLYNAFVYNESYFQATNRSGAGVTTLQQITNTFDVKVHYRFLTKDDSDYVGMAKSYQKYLVEKGDLKKVAEASGNIGMRLEFLGGEKERILFWDRSITMTTVSQMSEILKQINIMNPEVIYYGWQPLGASTMPPTSLKFEGSLGNLDQLGSLIQKITTDGGNFYLYLDPQAALVQESGYSPRNDLAMSITDSNLIGYNRNKVNFYLNIDALTDHFATLSKEVSSKLKAGLALDGIGSTLYSDFKTNHFINREDTIKMYQKLLDENSVSTSFYKPNDYLFRYMKAYYDMPLSNSGYIYTTDVVPFLQIVFAGYIPYYGPALNFTSNVQEDLLRQADFGIYPSYFLSNDVTAKILNTSSNWIYTSSYKQWAQEINRAYQWLNNLLGPVKGQEIVARQILAPGVAATTYSNNNQIIVNYNDQPYSAGDTVIKGKDAVIRQVLP